MPTVTEKAITRFYENHVDHGFYSESKSDGYRTLNSQDLREVAELVLEVQEEGRETVEEIAQRLIADSGLGSEKVRQLLERMAREARS